MTLCMCVRVLCLSVYVCVNVQGHTLKAEKGTGALRTGLEDICRMHSLLYECCGLNSSPHNYGTTAPGY